MEKRTVLAIILSLGILLIWNALVPRPPVKDLGLKDSQLSDTKEDISIPVVKKSEHPSRITSQQASSPIREKITTLTTNKLTVNFSNIGGTIKSISLNEYEQTFPVKNILTVADYANTSFTLDRVIGKEIFYSLSVPPYKITKRFSVSQDDYLISADVMIENISGGAGTLDISLSGMTLDMSSLDNNSSSARDKSLYEYSVIADNGVLRKGNAFKFSPKEKKDKFGTVTSLAFRTRYFAIIVNPQFIAKEYLVAPITDEKLKLNLPIRDQRLSPGESMRLPSLIYAGPQELNLLKSYRQGFERVMVFSNFGFFDMISKGIYWIMALLYKVIPNWGVCIILISLIIYGAMYPLTIKGMSSMKRMQSLQPQVAALREQYKNNPQRLNKEIMEIYKKNKVNPLGGCFPLLLQMPVFIGLYQVLWRSVLFKGAGFLWIKDLSQPDRLWTFSTKLPVVGNELNILPILMVIVMFFQQKVSAKNMVITDPTQAAQQKMMTTVFPLLLGFLFYKFASGLSLYFTTFYLLSTLTQVKISKMHKAV